MTKHVVVVRQPRDNMWTFYSVDATNRQDAAERLYRYLKEAGVVSLPPLVNVVPLTQNLEFLMSVKIEEVT